MCANIKIMKSCFKIDDDDDDDGYLSLSKGNFSLLKRPPFFANFSLPLLSPQASKKKLAKTKEENENGDYCADKFKKKESYNRLKKKKKITPSNYTCRAEMKNLEELTHLCLNF